MQAVFSPRSVPSVRLVRALADARANTDALFSLVRPGSLYERPIPERHRIIFYVGHVEAFDWNLICRGALDVPSFHPSFDRLFSFGIDPPPGQLPRDQPSEWPRAEEVHEYCARVRHVLDAHVEQVPELLLNVAVEHRLMHAETFSYMLHSLNYARRIVPVLRPPSAGPAGSPARAMIEVPGGLVLVGREPGDGFGWDNELPAHSVQVAGFALSRYKVTNGEYLRFVETGAEAPPFWRRQEGQWTYRGMFREIPLPLDWPVYCTHDQASAYARWTGGRLPSEPEFHLAAYGTVEDAPPAPDPVRDNFGFRYWDPLPVHASAPNHRGFVQMIGNGWEWTSTPFAPFHGFKPFSFYPGYSADFFDGEHFVLKGASSRTAVALTRPSFRNWFRRSYPYMYAGFRVAAEA